MQIKYITTQQQAQEALQDLESCKKVCLDYETTGLDARIARPRLLQLCDTKEEQADRIVYVFDLFKLF